MVLLENQFMWTHNPVVKIVADSISESNVRLTTFEVTYWRPILPEFNTHRAFSRNTASSRAKPFSKRVDEAVNHTFVPAHWNAEQPGMVGGEEFSPEVQVAINTAINSLAKLNVEFLTHLDDIVFADTGKRIHKQYLNRYLEPFIGVTQLITATDWDNFFKLRLASDAQPEIRDVATMMLDLYQHNEPKQLKAGEYHLPYVSEEELGKFDLTTCKQISVARCARISYKTYESGGKVEKDIELFDRLFASKHMSPFEHVAKNAFGQYFNLNGWKSLRYELEMESDK